MTESVTKTLPAISLRFTIKQGLDEDAGYALETERFSLLAAFDGMGGMGSRRFQQLDNRTSAYLASHFYAHILEKDFYECLNAGLFERPFHYPEHLRQLFWQEANRVKAQYLDREQTMIVGNMARSLPSTAAIALVDKARCSCVYMWAGDSRGYFLSDRGLYQITQDHVKHLQDSFTSLYEDAPMNNFINADHPFELFVRPIIIKRPGVILTATDGAFGCLPTPMHFEGLLLSTLLESKDAEQWLVQIKNALLPYANDDVTLVMQGIGYESFQQMQRMLRT